MLLAVLCVALSLSVLAFLIFVGLALRQPKVPLDTASGFKVRPEDPFEAGAKLLEALAKVIDSLAKAGPLTAALVASIGFLLIAAYVALQAPR
jgi:hypothetical protein